MELRHLSANQLNMFRECPRRWYYYASGYERGVTDVRYAEVGRAVHEAIEGTINGTAVKHRDLTEKFDGWMLERYRHSLEAYLDLPLDMADAEAEVALEAQVRLDDISVQLIGKIDAIKGSVAYDWKTGRPNESERIQAAVYQYLMRRNGIDDPEVRFVHLNEGRPSISTAPDYPDDYVEALVARMLEHMRVKHFPAYPGKACRFCPYTVQCEVGQ